MSRKTNFIKVLVGTNIKKNRELQGVTQEQLAEIIGINATALSDIERGKTYPLPENLEKIANALKIPCELLFVNSVIDPKTVEKDFVQRIEYLKNDAEKFTILYNYLKVLTSSECHD